MTIAMSGAADEWLWVVVEVVAGAGTGANVGGVCLFDSFEKRNMGKTSDRGGFRRGKYGDGERMYFESRIQFTRQRW